MKIAIVTGASSGLGREFVRQIESLYRELDEIWIVARREDRLLEVESLLMTKVRIFTADLQRKSGFAELDATLQELKPDVRMLVNAAGYGKVGDVDALPVSEQAGMVRLNCEALTRMTCIVLPYMNPGSRIVNVASAAAFCPQPHFSVYAASKSYVLSFSDAMREELKPRGIFVTAVCPGPVRTEFFDVAYSGADTADNWKEKFLEEPDGVVRQALIDSANGKEISVYGLAMKGARAACKILPQRLLLRVMKRFWE